MESEVGVVFGIRIDGWWIGGECGKYDSVLRWWGWVDVKGEKRWRPLYLSRTWSSRPFIPDHHEHLEEMEANYVFRLS